MATKCKAVLHSTKLILPNHIITIIIIIIIITNEEIIVAFRPKTTRTRYKVKNKTARYVASSNIEKQLVTDILNCIRYATKPMPRLLPLNRSLDFFQRHLLQTKTGPNRR